MGSLIPSPHTLRVRRLTTGPDNDFGNATQVWVEHDWPVRSVDPGASAEPAYANRHLSNIAYSIHADASDLAPAERDEVAIPWVLDDNDQPVWHAVDGRPDDWTHGPWVNPAAGIVVLLARAEG